MSELKLLALVWAYYRTRLEVTRQEGAFTTEAAIITAILATLALAVGAVITAKVLAKAESIPTE